MKIITKKRQQKIDEEIRQKMLHLANMVYEQTLVWSGYHDDAIPDKTRELNSMVNAVLLK